MAGDKKLSPCPDSPNCVSSQSEDLDHHIKPLAYTDSRSEAKDRLMSLLQSLPRVKVVIEEPDYIKAEFTSAVFSFVDDVEFYFSETEKIIDVRSASRVGYYDFGVNRRRIEDIRTRFEQTHHPEQN